MTLAEASGPGAEVRFEIAKGGLMHVCKADFNREMLQALESCGFTTGNRSDMIKRPVKSNNGKVRILIFVCVARRSAVRKGCAVL